MKRALPDYIQHALVTGERTWRSNGYSRSHLVFSVAVSAYQNGWGRDDFVDEILNPRNLAGEKFQDMPEPRAKRTLEQDWEKAVSFVEANPPADGVEVVRKRLDHIVQAGLSTRWSGRTGNTDRHLLLTILALSYEVGTYTPAFSTRTLASVANKRQETVMKSISRLCESGWLTLITPSTYTKSARYEVNHPTEQTGALNSYPLGSGSSDPLCSVQTSMSHDIFSSGVRGATAGRLWLELSPDKQYTANDMFEALGLTPETCRNAAKKLAAVGLMSVSKGRPTRYTVEAPYGYEAAYLDEVMSVGEGVWEDESPDLTESIGRGDKRSERFTREREARKLEFAHYDRATAKFVDPFTGEALEPPSLAA